MRRVVLVASFLVCLFVADGPAEESKPGPPDRPCAADIEKFCASEKGNRRRVVLCLEQHRKELSERCRAFLAGGRRGPRAGGGRRLVFACREEAQKFCGQKRGRELFDCLGEHRGELSERCRTALDRRAKAGAPRN
ncbi:MAG: hypothetical protein KatS3mg076_2753 [Candidatus Binatia bacterium]|nr:MAG: hypothetical protein KatS3mg076_2753 [Candidatus Binatia bacterium]